MDGRKKRKSGVKRIRCCVIILKNGICHKIRQIGSENGNCHKKKGRSKMEVKKANLKISEFMEYMNIHRTLAYRLCHNKDFYPAFKIGKKILINKEKLDKWIAEQTMEGVKVDRYYKSV